MKTKTCIATMLATIGAIGTTWAAVALDVTKPPVIGPLTGPPQDSGATLGQWFTSGPNTSWRTHEFHDNAQGFGGGSAGTSAINGIVTSITYAAGSGSPITAFKVTASITNDTISPVTPWLNGNNSHNEIQNATIPYQGTMYGTMLTIEFALTDNLNQPQAWALPYTQNLPEIYATNETQAAWYCYDPSDPISQGTSGGFYVPAWDYGIIAPGQTVTQILDFVVDPTLYGGLPAADPRYNPLVTSFTDGASDILMNRTTSLKISNWVDGIWVDNVTYPNGELGLDSNASVFFVPEAGTSALLGLLGILALRRRR
jgi:hypothetical protein